MRVVALAESATVDRKVQRVSRFTIEFYEDEHGDSPVLRWLREELTPTQRRAIGVAVREFLQEEGIGVCRSSYGKQLGDGLFEFRLRHDAAEILRSVGRRPARSPAANASSCVSSATPTATGSCSCSAATTRAPDPSPKLQQREIVNARKRLKDFLRRMR
ncbi:MAG TPA: hypothetical protein VFF79_15555 [Conexibacter sp.]|jgi:hypothetical protein|nr:hypothetical protein [Conexibacter sp.]